MDVEVRTAEEEIARIASEQQGNVTREQLFASGLSRTEIDRRRDKGLLIRQFRGVYRVGHAAPSAASPGSARPAAERRSTRATQRSSGESR